jgi:hypothetical protein
VAAPTALEVRQYISPEVIAMLRAVARFEELRDRKTSNGTAVDLSALEDSVLLHARKLCEFAAASPDTTTTSQWALSDILGTHPRKLPGRLRNFLDESVTTLNDETTTRRWPKDIDGNRIAPDDPERLSALASLVLKTLRPKHRTTTFETEAGALYVEVLDRAHDYLEQRTPAALKKLTDCA